jgi:hypothetical protein
MTAEGKARNEQSVKRTVTSYRVTVALFHISVVFYQYKFSNHTQLIMSAFQNLASPAPQVEAAEAESAFISEDVKVEPAKPSEDARVEPAMSVEPASTVDDPHKFAPPITKEEVSRLSVAGLRGSGSEFESKVSCTFFDEERIVF